MSATVVSSYLIPNGVFADNIKIDVTVIDRENVKWIEVAQFNVS